jgi:hypothetical protein
MLYCDQHSVVEPDCRSVQRGMHVDMQYCWVCSSSTCNKTGAIIFLSWGIACSPLHPSCLRLELAKNLLSPQIWGLYRSSDMI